MNRPLSPRSLSHAGHAPSSHYAPRRDTFTARPVVWVCRPRSVPLRPCGEFRQVRKTARSDMSRLTAPKFELSTCQAHPLPVPFLRSTPLTCR